MRPRGSWTMKQYDIIDVMSREEAIADLLSHVRPIVLGSARVVESGLGDLGWTVGSRAVVEVLVTEGAMTVPHVARLLDLARQNVQRHVDDLVRLGHVRTRDNPAHRRSVLVETTPRGATAFRRLRTSELAAMDSLAPEHGVEEIRRASEVLAALERDIRERAAELRT